MKRDPRWVSLFGAFLLEREKAPFVWGKNDCCLFPADAILAFTGVDLAADFRDKYASEVEAFAAIASVAGAADDPSTAVGSAAAWCAGKAGLVEREYPLMAQRGDLVVIENAGRMVAAIVHLNGRDVVSVGESGLLRFPITSVKRAWAV